MFPTEIHKWLVERGLSEQLISTFRWESPYIMFPITSHTGKTIWKGRISPFVEGPKYKNPHGESATLYGWKTIKEAENIFVTEGEFDALRLRSEGLCAVSSMIGANGWKVQWNSLFAGKRVLVCFDADDAGRRGAKKAGSQIQRQAHYVRVLESDGRWGKDITDWLRSSKMMFLDLIKSDGFEIVKPPIWKPPAPIVRESHPKNRESILEVCQNAGIVLRKAGHEYVAKSPFRSETMPSFAVNPSKNCWYDHGEGEGGGVWKLKSKLGLL